MFNYILSLIITSQLVKCQLTRPNEVYINIVNGICSHYECDAVILIHTISNYSQNQDITMSTQLKNLQRQFNEFYMKTIVVNIDTLMTLTKNYEIITNIMRLLFVFLNCRNDVIADITEMLNEPILISEPIWLIFDNQNTAIDEILSDVYMPINSRFMISKRGKSNNVFGKIEMVTEVYQITPESQIISQLFALWSSHFGLIYLPKLSLYQRRNNLYGHMFRIAVMNDPPLTLLKYDENGEMVISGLSGKLMALLMERLNFTANYQRVYEYGILLRNNTWSGAVGALTSNQSDIYSGMLRITIERSNAIDFTMPIFRENFRLYMQETSKILTWDKYVKPFKSNMWCVLFGLCILTTITMTAIKWLKFLQCKRGRYTGDNKIILLQLIDTLFAVFGAFCNQAMAGSLVNSIRIVQFIIHVMAYVVTAAYSAVLISSLTVYTFDPPFTTLNGLLKTRTYKMGIVKASSDYTFFQQSKNTVMRRVFQKFLSKQSSYSSTAIGGLKNVCKTNTYIFMTSQTIASNFYQRGCKLMPLEIVTTASMAFGIQKNSPFRNLISSQILSLRESGIFKKIIVETSNPTIEIDQTWLPVELIDVAPLFVLLIGGGILSILIMSCEILINRQLIKRHIQLMSQQLNICHNINSSIVKLINK